MICGIFTSTDYGFTGEIRFFGSCEEVRLIGVEGKDNDKAPDFRILPGDDDQVEFGAAWRKTSKNGRKYISLKLNPVLTPPVYLRLYESETIDGEYELVAS